MKEDYISLKFSLESPIYFKLGDYSNSDFGLFEICSIQKPVFNTDTAGYDYELKLDAYYWKWNNKIFKYTPETAGQESSWNLTATLDVHAGIVLRNLKSLGYKYNGLDFIISIDNTVENKPKVMSYDNIHILDACFEMAKEWDCECWITENIIHFGRCELGDSVPFEIGVNVEEMSRSDSQSDYATRIYAFGSTKNIPANYRPVDETVVVNGVVQRRLMLPSGTPFIDAYPDMRTEEAIEQVVIFEDVFPRRTGTMSDITIKEYTDKIENADGTTTEEKWGAYRFKDTGIIFSKDYVLPGEELRIIFHSGVLNGMAFSVTFFDVGETTNEDGSPNDEQLWEIVRNEDYGRPLPGDVLIPSNGDTYILSGWDSTKIAELGLVAAAEQELKTETEKYVAKSKIDPSTYNCTLSESPLYDIGQKVDLINKAYFENGRQSRIIGVEYNLDMPFDHPVYTVGEVAAYSRIGELEDKVDNLTLKGQTFTGGSGSGVYLITSNDSTPATDSNTFSARRLLKMFLRKDQEDKASGIIQFLQGITIGENGSGITVLENGMSQAVVDYLYVKVKAVFDELEVKKKTYVGGEQIISPAGMKCNRVEELADTYRCYFKAEEDGVTIENKFTVGTLAISQECNIKVGVSHHIGNRYYWRLVTGIGADYIDLSKTVCDPNVNNDIPAVGDDIVALGHNSDITRQAAIILSSVNEVSPSILMYQGINDFTLVDKDVIGFDYDKTTGRAKMRVYGDAYIGARDESSYVKYSLDGGVEVNGVVHVKPNSTGAANLADLPDEILRAAQVGSVNQLLNSGFTGNYENEELEESYPLSPDAELYSKKLKHWTGVATINDDEQAVSGKSAVLGSLSQSVVLINGESYVFSYKAKGTSVSFSCGSFSILQPLTAEYQRYTHKFIFNGSPVLLVSGTATVCDIQLERGTIPTDWKPSPLDNDKSMAALKEYEMFSSAIKDGSTTAIGGLILANILSVGNYKDGIMEDVTAGISGIYNDNDDVAFWAGGTLEQAIRTVMKLKYTTGYNPTDKEWGDMANFVTTHGGDSFYRGYIYALGGVFRGKVVQGGGLNVMEEDGSVSFAGGKIRWGVDGNPIIEGQVTTSMNGTRIELDPSTNSIKMYNQNGSIVGDIRFVEEQWGGNINYLPMIKLTDYHNSEKFAETVLRAGSLIINDSSLGDAVYSSVLNPSGLSFHKNGQVTKEYPNK